MRYDDIIIRSAEINYATPLLMMSVSLNNNDQIVIKKADKSNTIVIMDKEQYILEGLRQLHSKHYVEVAKPDLQTLNIVIQEKLSEMFTKGTLDNETHRFLTDHQANRQCGRLYLLPKIHKIDGTVFSALTNGLCSLRRLPADRPIISQCDTPTYRIGAFRDHFLVPIVKKQSTYIQDTRDFIDKIESLCLPSHVLLVSYDVTSMYTNMEFDELLSAAEDAYINTDKSVNDIPYP